MSRELCSRQEPTPIASLYINTVPIPSPGAAGESVREGLREKQLQKQLHSRRDLPPFWVTVVVQGPQLWACGENKVFAGFWRSLQCPRYSWVCVGIATGDPRDAEQTEGGKIVGCGTDEGHF